MAVQYLLSNHSNTAIVNGSDGQSGLCTKDEVDTDETLSRQENCDEFIFDRIFLV